MTLAEYFEADFAAATSIHNQQTILRAWKRHCEETLWERSLSAVKYPHDRATNRYKIVRWLPFWMAIDDQEIRDALAAVNERVLSSFR